MAAREEECHTPVLANLCPCDIPKAPAQAGVAGRVRRRRLTLTQEEEGRCEAGSLHIGRRVSDKLHVVTERADGGIACRAKEAAHGAGVMIAIDSEPFLGA